MSWFFSKKCFIWHPVLNSPWPCPMYHRSQRTICLAWIKLLYGGRELIYDFFFLFYFLFIFFCYFSFIFSLFHFFILFLFSFCFHVVHFHFLIFLIVFFYLIFFFISFRFLKWNQMKITWPKTDKGPKINHDGRRLTYACATLVC